MGAGRASSGRSGIWPLGASPNRYPTRRQIDDGSGNEKRRDTAGPFLEQRFVFPLDDFEPPDAAADENSGALSLFRLYPESRVFEREFGRRDRELNKPPHLLDVFFLDIPGGVEVLYFAGDAATELRGFERGDWANAA